MYSLGNFKQAGAFQKSVMWPLDGVSAFRVAVGGSIKTVWLHDVMFRCLDSDHLPHSGSTLLRFDFLAAGSPRPRSSK